MTKLLSLMLICLLLMPTFANGFSVRLQPTKASDCMPSTSTALALGQGRNSMTDGDCCCSSRDDELLVGVRAAYEAATLLESNAGNRAQTFQAHEQDIDRKLKDLFEREQGEESFAQMKASLERFIREETN